MSYSEIKEAKLAIEPPEGFSCFFCCDTCTEWCCRKYREPILMMLIRNGFRPVVYTHANNTIKAKEGDIHISNTAGMHNHVVCQVDMCEKGQWRTIHFEDGKQLPHACCPKPLSPTDQVFDKDNSLMMEAIQRGWERITPPTIKEK